MLGTLFRVLAGFVLACIAAGLAFVLFAVTPTELASPKGAEIGTVVDWVLKSATQAAIFGAPFALIAAAIGEWQALRNPGYYILAGILIALAGFLAQHWSEAAGQHTVLNEYAVKAFLTSGFFAGLTYWLVAGQSSGVDVVSEPFGSADRGGRDAQAARRAPVSTPEVKPAYKPEAKPDPKHEAKPDIKADVKPDAKPVASAARPPVDDTKPAVKDPEKKA